MWMELNIINCSVAAAAAKSLLLHISALNLLDLIVLFCKYLELLETGDLPTGDCCKKIYLREN